MFSSSKKDSTRTRCAFEVGAADQGAFTTYLGPTGSQMNKKESLKDTARVLGSMYDAIEFRGFAQEDVVYLGRIFWGSYLERSYRYGSSYTNISKFLNHTRKYR